VILTSPFRGLVIHILKLVEISNDKAPPRAAARNAEFASRGIPSAAQRSVRQETKQGRAMNAEFARVGGTWLTIVPLCDVAEQSEHRSRRYASECFLTDQRAGR
jgi:hypothetical protein